MKIIALQQRLGQTHRRGDGAGEIVVKLIRVQFEAEVFHAWGSGAATGAKKKKKIVVDEQPKVKFVCHDCK